MALGRAWGAGKVLSDACLVAQNRTGRFLGTAFVARDIIRVIDALGEDGMLRYWGQFPRSDSSPRLSAPLARNLIDCLH